MRAVHPGEVLKDELDELGVTPTEFARQINVPPNRISQIIGGKRAVTGDTALRLGHWFGTEPQFWLNLQSAYEIRIAEERLGANRQPAGPARGRRCGRAAKPVGRRIRMGEEMQEIKVEVRPDFLERQAKAQPI